jgi:hypothetical protein
MLPEAATTPDGEGGEGRSGEDQAERLCDLGGSEETASQVTISPQDISPAAGTGDDTMLALNKNAANRLAPQRAARTERCGVARTRPISLPRPSRHLALFASPQQDEV